MSNFIKTKCNTCIVHRSILSHNKFHNMNHQLIKTTLMNYNLIIVFTYYLKNCFRGRKHWYSLNSTTVFPKTKLIYLAHLSITKLSSAGGRLNLL